MLKSDEICLYVDEDLGSYEPEILQTSRGEEQHNTESAALHHRSLLPVSSTKRNRCAGVPSVMLQKYSDFYLNR